VCSYSGGLAEHLARSLNTYVRADGTAKKHGPANSSQQPTCGRSWPGASAPRFSATLRVALLEGGAAARLSQRTLARLLNALIEFSAAVWFGRLLAQRRPKLDSCELKA